MKWREYLHIKGKDKEIKDLLKPWDGLKDLVILPFINKIYSTKHTHTP